MSDNSISGDPGFKRRDFLALAGGATLLAAFPFAPKPSVAPTNVKRAPAGSRVARIGIYPAIGICRVGGSDSYFLAPEVPGLPARPPGGFKDGTEKIKKQAQRFRLYGYDVDGRVIGEITHGTNGQKIEWSVHLANTKAAWYGFNNPLDNGDLAPGLPGKKRNQFFVSDEEREDMLVIDGGQKNIIGRNENQFLNDSAYDFEGRFWGKEKVALGQIKTDSLGRLIVIPPNGISNSPMNAPITSFADNDGWRDDWCDGPVQAEVTLSDGTKMQADSSWVACVGPNFAPEIPPVTSLYDAISDMHATEKWTTPAETPISFQKYIYPIFRRLALMEWVSSASNLREGWLGVGDFSDPAFMDQVSDSSETNRQFRQDLFAKFRDPFNDSPTAYLEERLKLPLMLGDGINYDGSPLQWFQFPKQQYGFLQLWADGEFIDDLTSDGETSISRIEDIDLELQPHALTEAALEPCSGGAFHPGVELTYYLRIPTMFARNYDDDAEPFRLAIKKREKLVQNVGRLLTIDRATEGSSDQKVAAPLGFQWAGDLTRWMGLPWQCDAFSCQQVVMQNDFPTAVWWPALLPINVLPEVNYDRLMDETLSEGERVKFFENRVDWKRGVSGIGYHANGSYWDGITNMIDLWERMGFVVKREGPGADAAGPLQTVPTEVYVEVDRGDVEIRFDWQPPMGDLPN